jgi:hypothetical protein
MAKSVKAAAATIATDIAIDVRLGQAGAGRSTVVL